MRVPSDAGELLEKITPKTKVLILPFPNNPTGAIMNRNRSGGDREGD